MVTICGEKRMQAMIQPIVRCGRIVHGGLVPVSQCQGGDGRKPCDYFGGAQLVSEATNTLPEVKDIICKLPTRKRVERLIMEVDNDSP